MSPPALRPFAKAIGLDLIVRPGGEVVLIELQHHYGRLGLMHLYPDVSRHHRSLTRELRGRYGTDPRLYESLRRVCTDKILTWRLLRRWQPSSFPCHGWGPALERWLDGLASPFLLAKPPRGGCGRGIRVFQRDRFDSEALAAPAGGAVLLQEYVESRGIAVGTERRMGCIRHIVHIYSDGQGLGFVHLPPYWRVAPAPYGDDPSREAFTANISSGAFPFPVDPAERGTVFGTAERVVLDLMTLLLGPGIARPGRSFTLSPTGEVAPVEAPARAGLR